VASLLNFLKREGFGEWESVETLRADLMRRVASALGGVAAAAQSEPAMMRELCAPDGGELMQSLARDMRVQRGARLAALKAALDADPSPLALGKLFARGGDLLGDPRLSASDQARLSRQGMEAFLATSPPQAVTVEVGAFARSVRNARDVVGEEAVRGLLAKAAADNLAAQTARWIAFGETLSAALRARWAEALSKQHKAWKTAPAAAKRLGTAPPWPPPELPDEFKPLIQEVEEGKSPPAAPRAPAPGAAGAPGAAAAAKPGPGAPIAGTIPAKEGSPLPLPRSDYITGVRQHTDSEITTSETQPAPAAPTGPALRSLRFGEQIEQLLKGRPEGVERLLAAMDVRAALHSPERAASEIERAAKAAGAPPPPDALERLRRVAGDAEAPPAWRAAAEAALRGFGGPGQA
jgi:hypothetical protein